MKMGHALQAPKNEHIPRAYLGILLLYISIANGAYALGGASLRLVHNNFQDAGCRSMHHSRSQYWLPLRMSAFESAVRDGASDIVDGGTNDENEFFVCPAQFVRKWL